MVRSRVMRGRGGGASSVGIPIPELVCEATWRGDRLDGEALIQAICSAPDRHAPPECYGYDDQVHEVDQVRLKELTHRRRPSADPHVATVGRLLGLAKHLVWRSIHETEACSVGEVDRWMRVMAQDEHR